LANTDSLLTVTDFRNMSQFRYNWVLEADRVFSDDIQQEDLYKVTYLVEGECAPFGEADACEQIEHCEYVWVDTSADQKSSFYPTFTDVLCSADIEEVLNPILIDEL
jgi:hypothetical protein